MLLKDRVAALTGAGPGIGRGGAEIMALVFAIPVHPDLATTRRCG